MCFESKAPLRMMTNGFHFHTKAKGCNKLEKWAKEMKGHLTQINFALY